MHTPVLVNEVLDYLNIKPDSKIIDATLDGGGHTKAILEKFPDVKILGIEFDPILFREVRPKLEGFKNLILINDSYVNLKEIAKRNNFYPDGILFDLGLSSWHYEESGRGFSFKKNEILDMRFNPEIQKMSAADLVNRCDPKELAEIIDKYGEEKFAREIAKSIVHTRKIKPIVMTEEFVRAISEGVPEWYKHRKIHFATKTFQALRIAVNDELGNVEKGILAAIEALNPGGRLVVISFHGLEDKTVKNIFKEKSKEGKIKLVVKGTIRPAWEEVSNNPRARSAKMKVVEKI